MTERAQALEAAVRALIEPMCERVTDNGIVRQKMLVVAGDDAFDRYRRVVELLAVQPPPPVGSPTTAHVAPIVGKVWTHHDGVLPDGSVCRTADVDALIAERTAQLQAALFDEQASHEATKCRLVAAEQSHEAAGNRVIELLKSTPVEPAGASEPPSEMDSGIVLLVSAASAASGYLERQQPDLSARLWSAVQLVLKSQPAPVSPVEPTPEPPTEDWYIGGRIDKCPDPRCGCSMEHSPDCAMPAPTGAPAPCVWRPKKRMAQAGCPESRHVNADGAVLPLIDVLTFHVCPYCKAPLTVER